MWYGVQDLGNELCGRRHGSEGRLRQDEFWAVKDINFELKRGECLGLIGHNGAGKTTLLRMLNGLIRPDQGRIEMRGTVGALIALGAGFNPILTGRENIYVNAAVLGMRKRYVDNKIEEIVDFAEIAEFIDSPIQTYSSGMNVRLGFAVAAILLEPDILFLDEVLAVGDIGFAMKCLNVVRSLSNKSAVVLVSHNMPQISWFCSRVMVLERGHVLLDHPNVSEGIDKYYELLKHDLHSSGEGGAEIVDLQLVGDGIAFLGEEPVIEYGANMVARLHLRLTNEANVLILIRDDSQSPIIAVPLHDKNEKMIFLSGEHRLEIPFGVNELNSGNYSFVVMVTDVASQMILARMQGICPFRVIAARNYVAKVVRPAFPLLIDKNYQRINQQLKM